MLVVESNRLLFLDHISFDGHLGFSHRTIPMTFADSRTCFVKLFRRWIRTYSAKTRSICLNPEEQKKRNPNNKNRKLIPKDFKRPNTQKREMGFLWKFRNYLVLQRKSGRLTEKRRHCRATVQLGAVFVGLGAVSLNHSLPFWLGIFTNRAGINKEIVNYEPLIPSRLCKILKNSGFICK